MGEWFGDIPGIIKERLRAQPSFAMLGEGVGGGVTDWALVRLQEKGCEDPLKSNIPSLRNCKFS